MWVCLRARVSVCVCESESSTQANPSAAPNAAGSTPWHSLKADITRAWHAIHKQHNISRVYITHTHSIFHSSVYIYTIYTHAIFMRQFGEHILIIATRTWSKHLGINWILGRLVILIIMTGHFVQGVVRFPFRFYVPLISTNCCSMWD